MKRIVLTASMLVGVHMAAFPVSAAAQSADPWRWSGAVYAYLPTISGKSTFTGGGVGGAGGGVGIDAGTILEHLKFTFMGSLEAHNGRWGVFADVVYMDVGASKSGTRDLSVGGVELPADVSANANYDLKGGMGTAGVAWRAVSGPSGTLDLLAGARHLAVKQTLTWEFTGSVGPIPVAERSGRREIAPKNWDVIVGAKGRFVPIAGGGWFVPLLVDVGAGDSELTWQAVGGLGYTFPWGDVVGAWRHLDYRFKSGKSIESLEFSGPTIAAVFRW